MSNEGPQRLYRSRRNSMVCGVCGGLGDYLNIDPTFIRIGLVLLVFASFGGIILAYIAACVIIPEEPREGARAASSTPSPEFGKKMDDFGKRIEEMGQRLGKAAEEIGQKVGAAATEFGQKAGESAKIGVETGGEAFHRVKVRAGDSPRLWFGVVLVALGLILLAQQLEVFEWTSAYLTPTILIVIGIAIVAGSLRLPPIKPPAK
ncbi:MAG: PspC domain-containing protein [bacterium]